MTSFASAEIQRENLTQWRLGRGYIWLRCDMPDDMKRELVRVGVSAMRAAQADRDRVMCEAAHFGDEETA